MIPSRMNWTRALAAWVMIAAAETLHGILRQLLLAPFIGELAARQLGVFTGSLIIFAVAWFTIRWIGARTVAEQIRVGSAWVVLMVVFELALGTALGYSPQRILADYDLTKGGMMGFGITFMLFAPFLAAKSRPIGKDRNR